jgi:hypothetical protein
MMLSQAADFCSILTCATMFAFSHSLHVLVKVADKDDETYSYIRKDICFSENETVPEQLSDEEKLVIEEKNSILKPFYVLRKRILNEFLKRFIILLLLCFFAAGCLSYFLAPDDIKAKLGFFGSFLYQVLFSFSMKDYFDEVADIASIFLFACFVCDLMLVKHFFGSPSGIVYQIKNPSYSSVTAGINFSPLKLALSRAQFLTPFLISCFTVLFLMGVSFVFYQKTAFRLNQFATEAALNFFKNSLDEVADVCSILTVALALFFALRVEKFVQAVSGMAYFYCVFMSKEISAKKAM